jgi:hypothetical protein
MKKLCLAMLVAILALSLFTVPVAGQSRSNKGGQDAGNVGDERAAQVHAANENKKKKDKDHNPAASTNKTHGQHKAVGHRH